MRIWKRLLGTALCLCAAVCVMSVSASAAAEHSHPICGETHKDIGDHTEPCGNVTWTEVTKADVTGGELKLEDGQSYYLGENIQTTKTITITGTVNLCLNGNTLSRTSTVIEVKGGATLNICDCQGGGIITAANPKRTAIEVAPSVDSTATLNLYSGEVSGSVYDSTYDKSIIKLDSSSARRMAVFNMYGGKVQNSYSDNGCSAVRVTRGSVCKINIYGGEVTCDKGDGINAWNSENAPILIAGGTVTGGNDALHVLGNLTLSGNPTICHKGESGADIDITTTNNHSTENNYITVTNDFAPNKGTEISVDVPNYQLQTGRIIAKPAAGASSLSDRAQYFVSAEKGYFVESNSDGDLQLTACAITGQPTVENSYTVTANGSDDKVKYQWYSAKSGDVPVADTTVTNKGNLIYTGDEWSAYPISTNDEVTGFTLTMKKNAVLALLFPDDESISGHVTINSASISDATGNHTVNKIGSDFETVTETEWPWEKYKKCMFIAPADGDYTLKISCTADSEYAELKFTATVTADMLDKEFPDQTAAALYTTGLPSGSYICKVTWENKTTLNSQAVRHGTASSHAHSWSSEWTSDTTYHWHECENANCDVTENSAKDGYGPHSGGAANCTEEAVCASCGTAYGGLDTNGHDWGEWEVKIPATETTVGSKTRTCKRDPSHTETETIPQLDHTHKMKYHPAVDADCGTGRDGNIEYWFCPGCGKFFRDAGGTHEIGLENTVIHPAHDLDTDWSHDESSHWHECKKCGQKPDSAAHVYDDGDDETCNICDYTRVVHRHVLEQVPAVPATCVSAGNTEHYRCTACGERFRDDRGNDPVTEAEVKLSPLGHDWQEATCETPKTCKRTGCSATEGRPLGHDWTTGWMSDAGFHWHECLRENCGEKSGHAAHIPGPEATEAAPQTCTECGYVIAPALEHTHVYDRQSTDARYLKAAAGCTTKAVYFCSCACGEAGTETFEAGTPLGHDWGRYIVTTPATETSEGVETRTCQRDSSHTQTRAIPKLPASTYGVSGEVRENGGDPAVGVTVTLVLGDREIASKTTDSEGKYSFGNVAPGVYNLVAENGGIIMTVKVEVISKDVSVSTIIMPQGKTNSVVEVKSEKPEENVEAVVGNLETVFKTTGDDKPFTDKDQNVVNVGGSVEIKLTVTKTDENETSTEIKQELPANTKVGVRLELDVHKTVTPNGGNSTVTRIENTDVLLETIIRLPAELQGKDSYTVYRLHGRDVHALTAQKNTDGEYIEVSPDKTAITIHAKLYSEYVIAYQERGETGGSGGNGGNGGNDNGGGHDDRDDGYTPPSVPARPETHTGYRACRRDDACPIWPFADAAPTAWYHDGVHYCIEKGLMHGISADKFLPDGSVTRAQLAAILWRLVGNPAPVSTAGFSDVADGAWYAGAVRWAADSGVVRGYADGRFRPNDAVTREQMAALLYRFAEYKGYDVSIGVDTDILRFTDGAAVGGYAVPAMRWACGSGLMTGTQRDGGMALAPKDTTTRAQTATLLTRFQSTFAKEP